MIWLLFTAGREVQGQRYYCGSKDGCHSKWTGTHQDCQLSYTKTLYKRRK